MPATAGIISPKINFLIIYLKLTKNNLFFLNTAGSLYSLNCDNMQIMWFINLNQTLDLNPGNLFNGIKF